MRRVIWIALAFLLCSLAAHAQTYTGNMDTGSCSSIAGWAWTPSEPNTPVSVDIVETRGGSTFPVATVLANQYRADLYADGYGNGYHGFSMTTPAYLKDGNSHALVGYVTGTTAALNGEVNVSCSAGSTGYQYYYSDALTSINASNWAQNRSVSASSSGLTATSANGGSLISSVAVPDGTGQYEVASTITLAASGGTYVTYLDASSNALSGPASTGTYYSVELQNPTFNGPVCSATLALYKSISSVITTLTSSVVSCHTGMVIRAVRTISSQFAVYINNQLTLWAQDSDITTGQPGVGARDTPSGNSVAQVQLGPLDRIAPNPLSTQNLGSSSFPNRVDLQWQGVTDDSNGTGIATYAILRNGTSVGDLAQPEYSDEAVSPSTTYSYTLVAADYHLNESYITIQVTTPPAGSIDPRRVGIRSTGTYWGGQGENIDVLSGNVNFTLPVLKAQARGGWGVTFNLSYNSQNWRQDYGGTWNLGRDVGYGYGWSLMAGSLTPYWTGYFTLDHYIFTDASGAQYRLNIDNGGVWTSSDSIYVSYDSNTGRLYFRDGSYWVLGCTSLGSEQDAGTMYPTTFEDTNGNQILVAYFPGQGMASLNSSARIQTIADVRATGGSTYQFFFNTDAIPHLTEIINPIHTPDYQFSFAPTQTLTDPFAAQNFGPLNTLASMIVTGENAQYSFAYDTAGEMTQAAFPYGGYLKWAYGNTSYSSGSTQREIQTRILSPDGTQASELSYPFAHEPSTNTQPVHQYTTMTDASGAGQKQWWFSQSGANIGLVTEYQGQQLAGGTATPLAENDFTWTQDANGNFYIGSSISTVNASNQPQQSRTDQTVDANGNVTQVKQYDYGNLTTPARTYTYQYLNSSAYQTLHINNRLTSATVTDGTNQVTLATINYDVYGTLPVPSPAPSEWDSSYASQYTRGNPTSSVTLNGASSWNYDATGTVSQATINGVTTNSTTDSSTNYAAPSQLSVGFVTTTLTYSSFLGVENETGANQGDTASTVYDQYARKQSTTSPFGATTTYTYSSPPYSSSNPPTITATINGRWTRQTFDGVGHTILIESGDANGTKSQAESVYAPCGCSPMEKLSKQAMPHAVGATPVWTTYTYDGIGRTLSVLAPDGASATTYAYQGNTVKVTDPAGKWKIFEMDAFGNLTLVAEPDPANPTSGVYYTGYGYDLLNHLIQVSMPRPTGTQTRTFVYSGNLLMSATNPENGTVIYTYNSMNKVATRTDAKGQKIQYTYDGYGRLIGDGSVSYYYDYPLDSSYSQYTLGRLAAVQYCGGFPSEGNFFPNSFTFGGDAAYGGGPGYVTTDGQCTTTFTEMYSYNQAGAKIGKRLRITRTLLSGDWGYPSSGSFVTRDLDLNSSYTYDNEGRMTSLQYPSYTDPNTQTLVSGPNLGYAYDTMGRLNTMTDLAAQNTLISGTIYGPSNELLSITGTSLLPYNETRSYNSMLQLTNLQVSCGPYCSSTSVNISYAYSATENNGKITSQTDSISGEQVQYTYDVLNRLASAQATNGSWGQSYSYDGFGNLTDRTTTAGSVAEYHVVPDPATNHLGSADTNGNPTQFVFPGEYNPTPLTYDIENRLTTFQGTTTINGSPEYTNNGYSYAPGNRRVWQGSYIQTYDTTTGFWDTTVMTDEVTFWGVNGQKLGVYPLMVTGGLTGWGDGNAPTQLTVSGSATETYFGGKLITGNGVPVLADRLGTIGKYYPYGQARSGAQTFTGYFRDSETGLDYAINRYHNPGTGRFLTPDAPNPRLGDPGSWNLYAYVGGDPINRVDPQGKDWCDVFSIVDTGDDDCDPMDAGAYDNVVIAEIAATLPNIAQNVCAGMGKAFNATTDSCDSDSDADAPPPCEVEVGYTPIAITFGRADHLFFYVNDGSGWNVVDAGPTNNNPLNFGPMQTSVSPNGLYGENTNPKAVAFWDQSEPCSLVQRLEADADALNDVVPYSLPRPGSNWYNSNAFVYTVVTDIGIPVSPPAGVWVPGWGNYIPLEN